jgi:hypothetical protein
MHHIGHLEATNFLLDTITASFQRILAQRPQKYTMCTQMKNCGHKTKFCGWRNWIQLKNCNVWSSHLARDCHISEGLLGHLLLSICTFCLGVKWIPRHHSMAYPRVTDWDGQRQLIRGSPYLGVWVEGQQLFTTKNGMLQNVTWGLRFDELIRTI